MDTKVARLKNKLNIDDIPLTFGKFKRRTPKEIARIKPDYIVWMWETLRDPPCSEELYKASTRESAMDIGSSISNLSKDSRATASKTRDAVKIRQDIIEHSKESVREAIKKREIIKAKEAAREIARLKAKESEDNPEDENPGIMS